MLLRVRPAEHGHDRGQLERLRYAVFGQPEGILRREQLVECVRVQCDERECAGRAGYGESVVRGGEGRGGKGRG